MTSDGASNPVQIKASRGEKPHLLLFNRKLRHLHGISLRNLSLTPALTRPRGKTIDDEALPYTLSSPSKLLAINESHELAHSHSSQDLSGAQHRDSPSNSSSKSNANDAVVGNGHAIPPATPTKNRLRRASTLDWGSASPKVRRQKVQDAITRHTADVFFSLHVDGVKEPVYVSEVARNVMNPDFRFFDLGSFGPAVTRADSLTLKLWARADVEHEWTYLLQLSLDLRSLHYIGKSIENLAQPISENTLFIHLTDGIYAYFPTPQTSPDSTLLPAHSSPSTLPISPTSSYDALLRLSTLDSAIQDALHTRKQLTSQLTNLLTSSPLSTMHSPALATAKSSLTFTRRAVQTTQSQLSNLINHASTLRNTLQTRRRTLSEARTSQLHTSQTLASNAPTLTKSNALLSQTRSLIMGQRRRLCASLLGIYPIEPLPDRKPSALAFSIRNLYLPNSVFTSGDVRDENVSAALGYVAQLVRQLSLYLGVPLIYPIMPRGSSSYVTDPVSLITGSRVFPLHTMGSKATSSSYRFDYAVYLLNKNIELLASSLNLRLLDIRQTLPNLKYVLFLATAGPGEVPSRKAGGVRGLSGLPLRSAYLQGLDGASADGGGISSSRGSSRRGSEDSADVGAGVDALRRRVSGEKENDRPTKGVMSLQNKGGASSSSKASSFGPAAENFGLTTSTSRGRLK